MNRNYTNEEFLDRRMRPRVTADLRAHLEELDGPNTIVQAIDGRLTDLGGQGMSVVCSMCFPAQRKIQITMSLDELGLQFNATGTVCWSKLAGDAQWENGIRFPPISNPPCRHARMRACTRTCPRDPACAPPGVRRWRPSFC